MTFEVYQDGRCKMATEHPSCIYPERILRSIAESDTPSPLEYQLQILCEVGFSEAEILHKTCVFAAYYAVK